MILAWAASILGFSLEKSLITTALQLLKLKSPTQFMNLLMRDPTSAIKKINSLPSRYRKLLEKRIEDTVKGHFGGGIKLKIDFNRLSKELDKNPKLHTAILKWNDNNVEVKKNGAVDINQDAIANINQKQTDKLESEIGKFVKMSSSWITGGVVTREIDSRMIEADIYIHGKAYDFTLEKSVWNRMVRAVGSHGTGAGSVIWDSEFRFKRKLVKSKRARYTGQKGTK